MTKRQRQCRYWQHRHWQLRQRQWNKQQQIQKNEDSDNYDNDNKDIKTSSLWFQGSFALFCSRIVLVQDNIKMTWVLWPQAHFICPCPTLSKGVTGKSCRSLLPPHQSFPSSPRNSASLHILFSPAPQHSTSSKIYTFLSTQNTVHSHISMHNSLVEIDKLSMTSCCFSSNSNSNSWPQCMDPFLCLAQCTQYTSQRRWQEATMTIVGQSTHSNYQPASQPTKSSSTLKVSC